MGSRFPSAVSAGEEVLAVARDGTTTRWAPPPAWDQLLRRAVAAGLLPFLFFASPGSAAPERQVDRIPTRFTENGKAVALQVIVYAPDGAGPFPALVFNHGSTGRGDDPTLFTRTFDAPAIARLFIEKGWLVLFPQRRGRGGSDGLYDEGFQEDHSRYACVPHIALRGLERAKEDLAEVLKYVERRSDVDAERLLIGGVSRGGILSLAFAAEHPRRFAGVLNFVGGWTGEGCGTAGEVNTATFAMAARFRGPTLWLYGDDDPFYSLRHSQTNFAAFLAHGGRGEFLHYALGPGVNGHHLLGFPDLWSGRVSEFVDALE